MGYYIYRFFNANRDLLYIGKTNEINRRMQQHFNGSSHLEDKCIKETAYVEYIELETKVDMDIKEVYYIAKYKPIFNKVSKYDNEFPSLLINEDSDFWIDYEDPVLTTKRKRGTKKATFELDEELHKKLKIYAALEQKMMVDILSEALVMYFNENT